MELKLNGSHQLLAYADVNLPGDNIDTARKFIVILSDASKEVDRTYGLVPPQLPLMFSLRNGRHSTHAGLQAIQIVCSSGRMSLKMCPATDLLECRQS
jgi:hypothetical protein